MLIPRIIKALCLAAVCSFSVPSLAVAGLAAVQTSAPQVEEHVHYSAPANWVQPLILQPPERVPEAQLMDGLYYLLVDRQVRVPDQSTQEAFHHYATYIANEAGVEAGGQISIDFDPLYERLALHRIQVIRNGEVVDLLHQADISLLRRETQLENLLYDGQLSANIILPDVRVGDTVEYSYAAPIRFMRVRSITTSTCNGPCPWPPSVSAYFGSARTRFSYTA